MMEGLFGRIVERLYESSGGAVEENGFTEATLKGVLVEM
jgi:hypothetical protein